MKSLNSSPDPTYSSVNLSIYAIAEVFVGVFTACLPPLRKTFDDFLHKVLPAGLLSSRGTRSRDSYALEGALKVYGNPTSDVSKEAKATANESDADSDYAILEEHELRVQASQDEILRTTQVSITVDDKSSQRSGNDSWA
jgi:hypothetical protein